MKKPIVMLGLLTLSTVTLAGCGTPHHDNGHPHRSDAGQPMIMDSAEPGMDMHGRMASRHQGGHQHGEQEGFFTPNSTEKEVKHV